VEDVSTVDKPDIETNGKGNWRLAALHRAREPVSVVKIGEGPNEDNEAAAGIGEAGGNDAGTR
jgi:hypothetical protein